MRAQKGVFTAGFSLTLNLPLLFPVFTNFYKADKSRPNEFGFKSEGNDTNDDNDKIKQD